MVVDGFRSWIKLQILLQQQFNFLLLIIQNRKTVNKILSHLPVDEQILCTKLLRLLKRKTVLKGKLGSYSWFHKWQPSSHKELLVFLGLLTISTRLINMSSYKSLLENQILVLKAHQLFGPAFTKSRLLILHSMLHFTGNEIL